MVRYGFIWFHMVINIYIYIYTHHIFPIFDDKIALYSYVLGIIIQNQGSPVLDQPVSWNDTGF